MFLDSQRALRGYQATRQNRFLETYYVDRGLFAVRLGQLRKMAWKAVLPGVMAQARTAQAVFQAGDPAVALPAGASRQTAALFATAAARLSGAERGPHQQLRHSGWLVTAGPS